MRRGILILLMLLLGMGPLPASLQASGSSRIPACCRGHGAHKCVLSHTLSARSGEPLIEASAHCSSYPDSGYAAVSPVVALAGSRLNLSGLVEQERAPGSQASSARRRHRCTTVDRGPPAAA